MLKKYDQSFFQSHREIPLPKILPLQLQHLANQEVEKEMKILVELCQQRPEDFFKRTKTSISYETHSDGTTSVHTRVTWHYDSEDFKRKEQYELIVSEIKTEANRRAFEEICRLVERDYGEVGLSLYKEYRLAEEQDEAVEPELPSESKMYAFLRTAFGEEFAADFLKALEDESDSEGDEVEVRPGLMS